MDRVLDRLWIGSLADFSSPLRELGFVAVVDLRCETRGIEVSGNILVMSNRNRDGDPWTTEQLETILNFISLWIKKGKVLIACAAGMSRSAAIVIGFMVRCGWDAAEAFERVRAARPCIAPLPMMLETVLK